MSNENDRDQSQQTPAKKPAKKDAMNFGFDWPDPSDLNPINAISSAWDSVEDAGSSLGGLVEDGLSTAKDLVVNIKDGAVDLAESVVSELGDLGESIWDETRRVTSSVWNELERVWNKQVSAPWPNPTQTEVGTTIARALEDNAQPDTIEETVVNGVLLEQKDMAGALINAVTSGANLNVEEAYRYARDTYTNGLPRGSTFTELDAATIVHDILSEKEGYSVNMDYFLFQPPNHTHVGWTMIMDSYGYEPKTNRLRGIEAAFEEDIEVYLEAIIPIIPKEYLDAMPANELTVNGRSASNGYSPNSQSKPKNAEENSNFSPRFAEPEEAEDGEGHGVRIRYSFEEPELEVPVNGDIKISIDELFDGRRFFQTKYSFYDGQENHYRYWFYAEGGDEYPELDSVFVTDKEETETNFLPIVQFRRDFENLTDESRHDTEEYKTTKELMDILGIDYQSVGEAVDENPDIDQVKQAVLMFAVPFISEDQVELNYLFEFFKRAWEQSRFADGSSGASAIRDIEGLITIKDNSFDMAIDHRNIRRQLRSGNIGKPGTFGVTTGEDSFTRTVQTTNRSGDQTTETVTVTTPLRKFRKQITSAIYEEYVVVDARAIYTIDGSREVVAKNDSEKFLVPVDKKIADQLNYKSREKLYFRSLHYVFNSKVTEEGKWYERPEFQFVLFVAAIAITILTWGSTWKWVVSLGLTLTASVALFALIIVGLPYLATQIAAELGVENTLFAAVVIAAVAMYMGSVTDGGYAESFWAQMLMAQASNLVAGANYEVSEKLSKYNSEFEEFEDLKEEKYQDLEEQREMLGLIDVGSLLDPMAFIGQIPDTRIGESPEEFYSRTVHSGNIGTLAYDEIEYFVDASLKLPGIDDTAGDQFNA